ncbi:AIR synthase [candidate division KSB1 bacterium]|nr:MAG: AIR synthase [candidate division KSB1 bacterium]
MNREMPEVGKISPEIFDEIILPQLGHQDDSVLVGPQHGVDVGVVDLGNGKVMAMTSDPVFIVPEYGWERAAWFAIHILASDASTSGLPPRYMTIDLNLPLEITSEQFARTWSAMHSECQKLGISIVTGHTGRYHGCNYPMVGGATVISVGSKNRYVTPKGAVVGDKVIITKGAAVEAAGLFAVTFPQKIAQAYGNSFAEEAENIFWQMSVVKDALTAVEVGVRDEAVTAMHDATECGVWGGLYEVAQASGVGMLIHKEKIIVQENIKKICQLFEIDPYSSISEGTLIITCRPQKAQVVIERLSQENIPASIVGEVIPIEEGIHLQDNEGTHPLKHPRVDPFWLAFAKAAEEAKS